MKALSSDPNAGTGVESLIGSVPFTVGMATTGGLGIGPVTQLVTPDLVHKQNAAEMLLTRWVQRAPGEFTVNARWPVDHTFYTPTARGDYDPMLVAETVRQTTTMLAHAAFGVPHSSSFSMNGLTFDVEPFGLEMGRTPADLVLSVRCDKVRLVKGRLRSMTVHLTCYRNGVAVAYGTGDLVVVGADTYDRVRGGVGHRQVTPTAAGPAPASVGRTDPRDVVLGDHYARGDDVAWTLRVDTAHPVLFDHPLDHIPGMLMLEAARQAFVDRYGAGLCLGRLDAEFLGYAELDAPCEIVLSETRGAVGLAARLEQSGRTVATMTLTARHPARVYAL